MRTIVLILCLVALSSAVPTNQVTSSYPDPVTLDNANGESAKREVRQVAVNVGPIGVGVGPFGGVGVRVGPFFNLGIAPSYRRAIPLAYPVAYPAVAYQEPIPIAYQAPAPVAYAPVAGPEKYSYSSNYRYNYAY